MDRFWLTNYPAGVPADIDPSLYPSVVALIEETFARYRDAKAYVSAAIAAADRLQVGHGHGPIHHFHAWDN